MAVKMDIDRAECDLAGARKEVVRLVALLDAARSRVVKFENFLEVARSYGEATPKDAKDLAEEGIEFHALPILPDERN